mmetsp:Transcript_85222/g.244688  ORF Transcript_85222/g.244688 Transcript_85222/m.244688 type:complete len:226 (+) Transcript_85222:1610-2287(+)
MHRNSRRCHVFFGAEGGPERGNPYERGSQHHLEGQSQTPSQGKHRLAGMSPHGGVHAADVGRMDRQLGHRRSAPEGARGRCSDDRFGSNRAGLGDGLQRLWQNIGDAEDTGRFRAYRPQHLRVSTSAWAGRVANESRWTNRQCVSPLRAVARRAANSSHHGNLRSTFDAHFSTPVDLEGSQGPGKWPRGRTSRVEFLPPPRGVEQYLDPFITFVTLLGSPKWPVD